MVEQYGVINPNDPSQKDKGYASRAPEPKPKQDPSPKAEVVIKFHNNAPVNGKREDIHHTVGFGPLEAAPGDHNHRTEGIPLFDGVTLTGSRAGNAAVQSIIALLVQWGAKDSTVP